MHHPDAPAPVDRTGGRRTGGASTVALALAGSLAVVALLARAMVVVGQAGLAEAGGWQNAWALPAFLGEDLALVSLWVALTALAGLGARRWPVLARALPVARGLVYACVVAWIAINVPVALVLSSPVTASLLHATGGALADSFDRYLTPTNLGAPLILLIVAWALPRWRGWSRLGRPRALAAAAVALALVAALAPAARRRVDTRGLDRNAVLALAQTLWRRRAAPPVEALAAAPPACPPSQAGAGRDLRALAGAAAGRNVVWVVLESTGARHLPFLAGQPTAAEIAFAPHLAALAEDAVVFDRAYAAYPESIKALFSLLCSRAPPLDSEASDYAAGRLPCAPVARPLRAAGYRTGLFHSGRFAYLGMDAVVAGRGFDTLADAATITSAHASSFGVDDAATAGELLRWVDRGAGRPFFAVYMPIAGHHPYHAPGDGPRPFPETSLAAEHRNDVFAGDHVFGRLRAGLVARGVDRRTLYVVTGDHGEAFREHAGNVAHALHLFEENVHVPLFVAAPGAWRGRQHAPQVISLLDLAPTTLALLGVGAPGAWEGSSALDPRPRVARFFTEQAVRRAGLVDGWRKLILDRDSGRVSLFDLARDAGERHDLAAFDPGWIAERRRCLEPGAPGRALAAR